MPWSTTDVDSHKRGLTATQKRQWVRIANSVLAKCIKDGGTDRTCAPKAIRQANGVVGHEANINDMIQLYIQTNSDYVIRSEIYEGRSHIVVPVVMMVEGVHNGSQGPLLHLAEELGRFPESWNGIPVTIQHPTEDEMNVSANSPKVLAREKVGRIFNTHMDGDKLKAEVWLDEKRLQEQSEIALQAIREQKELQVSVGVFTDEENVPGEWHGESYEAIARNHRPDHLALLPGGTGACSWTDGCGIRVNKKGGKDVKKAELDLHQVTMYSSKNTIVDHITDNENGYREKLQLVQAELDRNDTQVKYHYLVELYDNKLIYEVRMQGESTTYYQQNYTVSVNDEVSFTGDPVEVQREVNFVALEERILPKRTKFSSNNENLKKEVKTMSELKKAPCPDRVDELIAHALTKYTEKDKEWLLTQEADDIEKMFPNEPEKKETPQLNEDVKKQVIEDYKKSLPTEDPEVLAQREYGLKIYKAHREKMVKSILANTEDGTWAEDDFKEMKIDTLEKLYKSTLKDETDFSVLGEGTSPKINNNEQEPLYPTGIKLEEVGSKK